MPASMISAGAGSSPKVNGSSMATVATGPIPGSTPTRVPRKQPMKQYKMFCQVSATPSPKARLDSVSISRIRPERQRQAEQPDEDRDREGDHHRRERDRLERAHVARGLRADQHEHGDGGDQAEPLQRDSEQDDGQERDAERSRVEARHRVAVEREGAHRHDGAERGEQRPDQGREHGRPHAVQVPQPVLLCKEHEAAPDRHEDQAGPEILRRADVHRTTPDRHARESGHPVATTSSIDERPCPMGRFVLLDRPPEPVIGPAFGRTRWRAMTARLMTQSGRMFAFCTMTLKRSNSCAVRLSSSAALEGMTSTPPPAKRSFTSGMLRIFTTSALSLSTIACGVPLGANSAVQLEASTSFTPASCKVGHSELSFERLPMVTASTRTRPDFTCGAADELASTPSGMSPPASDAAAGAPPL